MSIFNFPQDHLIGRIFSVDTATVIVNVDDFEKLKRIQVNQLVAIASSKAGQHLIGIISRISRRLLESNDHVGSDEDMSAPVTENIIKVNLIGTLMDRYGEKRDVFKRNLDSVPEIDAECFPISGRNITNFMKAVSQHENYKVPLSLGKYSLDENAQAYLDGDKLFQRHAVIVGSTGSGKSWTVAKLIEQIALLPMANCILFDIHGEYSGEGFDSPGIKRIRIANPTDLGRKGNLKNNILMLPYWLLTYEEMLALLLDRSDSNAPNQSMLFSKTVFEEKLEYLKKQKGEKLSTHITIDSPVPYSLEKVLDQLDLLDNEMVPGSRGEKQGPYNGKLTRLVQRLKTKISDKRLGFLFQISEDEMKLNWMNDLCKMLMSGSGGINDNAGVKVIDFSEVPSDVLPLVISLVSRLIFSVQQWTSRSAQHPICLLCDEAHLYIPEATAQDIGTDIGLKTFERIAKEGRKYGVSLVVISQRPSEVNRTVLSQCNNFITLRLSNADDQAVIRRLLPDNLTGLTDVLPVLDVGEALVVGDASLLPSRIIIDEPGIKPQSATVKFWREWSRDDVDQELEVAVEALRKQSKN